MTQATLIVSTYNRPDALTLCLESILHQNILPSEVIIGDDGSTEETRKVINRYQKKFPVPLIHVWQEDKGFRLAKARNKCLAKASYEYIIQIDGDLILHRDFVKDHLAFCTKRLLYQRRKGQYHPTAYSKIVSKRPLFPSEHFHSRINPP